MMNIRNTIITMFAILAANLVFAGDSAPFLLDTVTTSNPPVCDSLSISWDASWIGGDVNATVVIVDNGAEVKRARGTGEFTHVFSDVGLHKFTYTTYIGGVAQDEVYTAYVNAEFGIDDVPPRSRATLGYDRNGFMIYNGWVLDYRNRSASKVTIPEGVVGIGRGAFKEMYDLETVTMPGSLRSISSGAFEGCTWIQELQFMSGLRYVGPTAFRDCSSLLRATFADGVEYIGASAFDGCWKMQSVRLPHTLAYIGDNAFTGCSAIRGVTVPTHLKTMQTLFPAAYSQIETAEVAEGEMTVMDDMFAGCGKLRGGATHTDMSMIPNTVTTIGARAFKDCTSLTAFVLPDSVVEIGDSVFEGCTSLWNVTLSRSLSAIPDYAFYGCSMLETMVVPESVTYLGNRFFSGRTTWTYGHTIANALYYLCANAPTCHSGAYAAISDNMTTYVLQESRSWDGRQGSRVLPQSWNGYPITYWTPNRFDVTFDANGGRFDSSGGSTWSEQQITDTTYALPSTEPTRPGWAFEGWWTEPTGGAEVRYTTLVTATRTHTIYAHWRSLGNTMTVAFNSNGGTVVVPGAQDYVPGQTFGWFPVPTRRGYTFQGWWTEAVNGIRMTEATQVPAADMELFAHWMPITYYVRFNANGGSGTMADQPFTYDVSGALKTHAFTRAGFAFTGWATTPSGQVRYAENKTVVNLEEVDGEIVDLYAVWSGVGYSVRFDSNGGTGIMDNQTIAVGETQNLWPCAFARAGFVFAGWAVSPTDAANGTVTYCDGAMVRNLATSNGATVPLYAVWVSDDQTVRITFNANGGSIAPDYWDCLYGTVVEAFPTPTCPGYTFAGWWTASNGGTQVSAKTKVVSSVTYYAHWTKNGSYKPGDSMPVSVVVGGKTETVTVTVGQPWGAKLPAAPAAPSGKTFAGWFTGPNGTGTRVTSSTIVGTSPVTLQPYFVEEESNCLYESVSCAALVSAASEYNGYLYDEKSGAMKGTIQVKVGKPGKKDGAASVKATVVVGTKKVTLKAKDKGKAVIEKDGPTEIELVGGEACTVKLGSEGISGTYGKYFIEGARNFFASKDKTEQAAANAALGKWLGPVNVVWDGGSVSVSMAKKGKAKVKGTLADGKTKVSAKSVFLVGEEWCAVPVAAPKANLAFTLWLSRDGHTAVVEGLGDGAIAGKPGVLAATAAFHVSMTASLWSSISGTVLTDYIPDGVKVTSNGGKWVLPKAGKVAYKDGAPDKSKLGENPSGLKLSYKAKDGSFKGSFKAYAVAGSKVKATTVTVTGVMVNGIGYGTATVKGKGSVAVTIE